MITELQNTLIALSLVLRLLSGAIEEEMNKPLSERFLSGEWEIVASSTEIAPTAQIRAFTGDIEADISALWGEEADFALAVAKCESNLKPDAYNPNDPFGGSHGIFQINGAWGIPSSTLYDVESNLVIAKEIYDKEGWKPWACAKKVKL